MDLRAFFKIAEAPRIAHPKGTPRPGGVGKIRLGAGKIEGRGTATPFSGNKMKCAALEPDVFGSLQLTLSTLLALYLLYYTAHWHSSGPSFNADHQLFQDLYQSTRREFDDLAERLVAEHPLSMPDLLQKAVQLQRSWMSKGTLLAALLEGEITLNAQLPLIQTGSLGTMNLLGQMADTHEGHLYKLKRRVIPG